MVAEHLLFFVYTAKSNHVGEKKIFVFLYSLKLKTSTLTTTVAIKITNSLPAWPWFNQLQDGFSFACQSKSEEPH